MRRFSSEDDLREFARELARNSGHESPKTVAEVAVISTDQREDDIILLLFGMDRFVDDPANTIRVWPKDVLMAYQDYPFDGKHPTDLRDLAVSILVDLIEEEMDESDLFEVGERVRVYPEDIDPFVGKITGYEHHSDMYLVQPDSVIKSFHYTAEQMEPVEDEYYA